MADETERIGKRMRERRKELRGEKGELSQREAAERMPGTVQGSEWSRWERGKHRPSDLDDVAKALGTSVADLVAGPLAERDEPEDTDLFDGLSERTATAAAASTPEEKLDQLLSQQAELLSMLSEVRDEQVLLRQLQERGGRVAANKRK
jgi:transcriptional regulator with XRE-family HTH domain